MQNDLLSVKQRYNLLLDFYGERLTAKQREILTMSIAEDCSFSEISKEFGISPQAVNDFVRRAIAKLEQFELTLGLVDKLDLQKQVLDEIETLLIKLDKLGQTEVSVQVGSIREALQRLPV